MRFSVIVPVYKTYIYLADCLKSLIGQTCQDFEVIMVDDGSPDNSGALCDEYAALHSNFRVIHTKNCGVASARNTGMAAANGEYILFLDSDDTLSPYTLETLDKIAGNADVVKFGMIYEDVEEWKTPTEKVVIADAKKRAQILREAIYQRISRYRREKALNCRTACGNIYRRELVCELGAKFPVGVKLGEDTCFNLAIFPHCKNIRYINECFYWVHKHGDSATAGYMKEAFFNVSPTFDIFSECIAKITDTCLRAQCEKLHACRMVSILKNCLVIDYCHKNNPKDAATRESDYVTARYAPLTLDLLEKCDKKLLTLYDRYLRATFDIPFRRLNRIMSNRKIRLLGFALYLITGKVLV